jgi:hypothetical protein
VKFCEAVINDCGAYVQIKKVERKPRKVKSVPPEKRAAKFKVMMEFAELKLKGLPAASLVDKAEAWLYDTKKRKLIHLVADSHTQAFTVKSNSIIGFSTIETMQKTVRKPADVVKAVQAAGKPAARKIYKDLTTTETPFNGRGTENLVILKAWHLLNSYQALSSDEFETRGREFLSHIDDVIPQCKFCPTLNNQSNEKIYAVNKKAGSIGQFA